MTKRSDNRNRVGPAERATVTSCNEHAPIETRIIQLNGFDNVFLKDEAVQISGAFKYRGVFAKLKNVIQGTHVVAASTGNHGIAVAEVASRMGFQAHIFLPIGVPVCKLKILEGLKAAVTIQGEHLDECATFAQDRAKASGALWISGFDDEDVIQGYQQIFSEITKKIEHIQRVFVPIGGGGLLAAALTYFSGATEVIGVGSAAADSLRQSLHSGMRIQVLPSQTIATGLAVPKVGRIAYELCVVHQPKIMLVDDIEIRSAMKMLWLSHGVRAEPAGVAALAGVLRLNDRTSRSVCIISGGNVDPDEHNALIV